MKQLSFTSQLGRKGPADGPGGASPGRASVPLVPRHLRFLHLACFFLFWTVAIAGRLFWLQVVRHSDFVERAAKEQQRTFEVAPRRGVLYDRNLHELAMTVLADSVYAVPSEIAERRDPDAPAKYQATAAALAKVVHIDPTDRFTSARQIAARLGASRNFAWIARKLPPQEVARVKALNLKGIYTQKEFKRFYPNNQLAAQLLGYVGTDDTGLGGMERGFDHDLHGVPGRMLTALDARRHVRGSQERDPQPGENLVLTIDENIQFIAERALDEALERTHAQSGTIVVQDPNTGQILALAIRPTFNPNDFRHATASLLRDHAISDVYEPGSTFKLVTYSAALDAKVANLNESIDCEGGKIELAGRIIHDDHYNGVLTLPQALWESSDVAAVKLALRMGSENFYKYIRAYGFGSRSGIELPHETRGLLQPTSRWSGSSIGSIAIGQEVAVTPIQLVTMASTLANGGTYLPPHILMRKTEETPGDGKLKPAAYQPERELPDPLPPGAHRVVSTMTAAEMRKLMEGVVLHGTGTTAQLNGYSAGGKTGTAQKIDVTTHRYSKTNYVASFVGIAPINNPAISVAVVIDSPKGNHFGHTVSAPVFQEVAQQVLEYLGVQHDQPLKTPLELAKVDSQKEEEQEPVQQAGDLNALFDAVNDLPADDPLRTQVDGQQRVPSTADDLEHPDRQANNPVQAQSSPSPAPVAQPDREIAASSSPSKLQQTSSQQYAPPAPQEQVPSASPSPKPESKPALSGSSVMVDARHSIAVPAFVGEPVRQVVESAGTAGLSLQILGSGIAREQVPAPGTMVPPGTGIVVRFSR